MANDTATHAEEQDASESEVATPTDAPFLSVFDVPVRTSKSTPASDDLTFDPAELYDSFTKQAEEERAEHERNEAEIAALLARRTTLIEEQAGTLDALAALGLTLDSASSLPHLIELMSGEQERLLPVLRALQEEGEALEQERADLSHRIKELEQFESKLIAEREQTIERFGGGERGVTRFKELEEKTRRTLEGNRDQRAESEERYESWRLSLIDAASPVSARLDRTLAPGELTSKSIDELMGQFGDYLMSQRTLNDQARTLVEQHQQAQQAIDEILADERIPARIAELEGAIEREQNQFADVVADLVLDRTSDLPVETLARLLASAFFAAESQSLDNQLSLPERAEQATALGKSLRATFTKIANQTKVDLKKLFEHLKTQRTQSNHLPAASRGYNDVLMFASLLGITGTPGKALEPFLIEAKALHSEPEDVQRYVRERVEPFLPLFAIVQAALDLASTDGTQQTFPSWTSAAAQSLRITNTNVDLTAHREYQQAKSQLTESIEAYMDKQRELAHEAADQARNQMDDLAGTHDGLVRGAGESQRALEEAQAALTITTDGLDQARELAEITERYTRLGPIKVGGAAKRLQDEIDRSAKLLLLKLTDLRRAGELVQVDLGRFEVSNPPDLVEKLTKLSSALEALVKARRQERDQAALSLRELVHIFDDIILSDSTLDRSINSPWLSKEESKSLFDQYRELEERYRATITEYGLR